MVVGAVIGGIGGGGGGGCSCCSGINSTSSGRILMLCPPRLV